jgi:hypothetical protein
MTIHRLAPHARVKFRRATKSLLRVQNLAAINPRYSQPMGIRGLQMASKRTELIIEKIVASCDGSVHGALEALLLVNEHLEAELHQLYTAVSHAGQLDSRFRTVH